MFMIKIGIDQSLSFTGVTISEPDNIYFIGITHKTHTKWDKKKPSNSRLEIKDYTYLSKTDNYSQTERNKFQNIYNIIDCIREIFSKYKNENVEVRLEGVSFGSRATTAIAELSGLNYMIRELCYEFGFDFLVLPPTSIKKFATGNGQADKELMTESFLTLNPDMRKIHELIKMDDIADSYFMAMYE